MTSKNVEKFSKDIQRLLNDRLTAKQAKQLAEELKVRGLGFSTEELRECISIMQRSLDGAKARRDSTDAWLTGFL